MSNIYGTSTGSAALAYTLWLECILNSQDVSGNRSNVTINFKLQRTDGSMGGYVMQNNDTAGFGGIGIDFVQSFNPETSLGIWIDTRNQAVVTLCSFSGYVGHNSDGTAILGLNATWHNHVSTYLTGGSISGTWTLPTIPRSSTPSINNFTIGNAAVAIVINRASTGFTHTLKYKFATQSGFTTIATGVESSFSWNTSAIKATLYALIPNALSDTITIQCDTYSGSTLIGSNTTTCTASVDTVDSAPTVSATAADSNTTVTALTGNNQVFVKNNSNALITPTVAAKNSASIASYFVVIGSKTYSNASVPASHTVNGVDSGTITIIATDSRGLTTTFVLTKTMIIYSPVVIGACLLNRDTPVSTVVKITSMANSSYWIGNFGAMANVLTLQYRWRIAGGTWSAYIPLASGFTTYTFTGTFSALNIYEFEVRATDKLTTMTVAKTILTGTPLIDIGQNDVRINGAVHVEGAFTTNPPTGGSFSGWVVVFIRSVHQSKHPVGVWYLGGIWCREGIGWVCVLEIRILERWRVLLDQKHRTYPRLIYPSHSHSIGGSTGGRSADHSHKVSNGQYRVTGTETSTYYYMTNGGGSSPQQSGGASADHTHGLASKHRECGFRDCA